ncbi:peptide MFS transporter [Peptacetobacter hiranonis]|uniref:Amino acid/peptide transporter n=1 Tax=Peptacetobacter hiranonis (strain DSM 13275 / JCM 10541 / KCTC 15199 / TO-931) TaxID=500633 RepID=B6FY25_PEPHT|nr:peptide MFS transporter [Peptacetobacter hiranonis]EEA85572.1 amino acid/peptide transporter [Peptacetobacter hiranonis DSM 13275]QEK20076.1 Di-/tripeptide transporter [Peptacetobacter hiranonis]
MEATKTKKKKPFGFYVCALGFTFERIAFYTAKYLLAIWIVTEVASGGLGLPDEKGVAMSAAFVAWTYITPIFGGYIADHWISPRICVPVGMILMGLGYLCTWKADSMGLVWAMIVLVSIGTGLFKGNLSGINGLLFHNSDELDEAFSIQYSFVNVGSFIGTTFIAMLATTGLFGIKTSFNTVFLICAIFMFIDAAWFILNGKALGDAGKEPFKADQREFETVAKKDDAAGDKLTSGDAKRIGAIVLVTLFSAIFWMVWYMAYMPAYYRFGWGDGSSYMNLANWYIGSFQIPTSWFDSMNALVCIALGPVLAAVWAKMAKRPQGDISMFKKTALGIILVGVSYIVMVVADKIAMANGQCSFLWLALVSMLMSLGEMIFSPLGNSFISKLAPAKVLGLLLGFWPIAVFIAQYIYPSLYAWLKTLNFTVGYGGLAAVIIALGVILWLCSGKLDEMEKAE